MRAYGKVTSLSFVENFQVLGDGYNNFMKALPPWKRGQTCFMFTWATNAALRKQCSQLDWEVKAHAKDQGGFMTYWGGPSWWAWFWQLARLLKTELLLLVIIRHLHLRPSRSSVS